MPREEKRTPENNWLLSDETIEELRRHYVEDHATVPKAAYRTGIAHTLASRIIKHKGWMRSPWDRAKHPWTKEVAAAVAQRDGRRGPK